MSSNSSSSTSVSTQRVQSVEDQVAEIRAKISKYAYERFLNRGAEPGCELEDWFAAESDLFIKCSAYSRIENDQVVVELVLPDIDPSLLRVNVTPHEMTVYSSTDDNGRQVFQTVRFDHAVEPERIEAEYVLDTLFVVAAISNAAEWTPGTMQVA